MNYALWIVLKQNQATSDKNYTNQPSVFYRT